MGVSLRIKLLVCALAVLGSFQFANALVIEAAIREVRKSPQRHLITAPTVHQ
jgi:hypothetical protein